MHNKYNAFPWITYSCIAICIAVFVYQQILLRSITDLYVDPIIYRFGAEYSRVIVGHQYWRLITAGFVHLSLWHLVMNIYALYVIGTELEMRIGHAKYFLLLVLSIIGGNLAVCLMSRSMAVGMSTGLYGIMLYEIVRLGVAYGFHTIWQDAGIRYTIIVNLVMNFMPGVSWQGHFGGAAVGIFFGLIDSAK